MTLPIGVERYGPTEKAHALAIAVATTNQRAAEETGIPLGTIKRWRNEDKARAAKAKAKAKAAKGPKAEKQDPFETEMEKLVREAVVDVVVEKTAGEITDKITALADELFGLAMDATQKLKIAIDDRKGERHTTAGSAWVRSLTGVLATSLDKAQLLAGKPTARPEVVDRHEHDITHKIIADPALAEEANKLLRRVAGRDPGAFRLDGERGELDSI